MKFGKTLKLALKAMLMQCGKLKSGDVELIFDGDEVAVGTEVFIEQTDDEDNVSYIAPADDEYPLEDGRTLVIADGKVSEIKEAETVTEEESDERTDTLFQDGEFSKFAKMSHDKIKANFEATYQEIQSNIYRALEAKGIDCYIIENTNDYVVVNQYDVNWDSTLVKYEITIDEDGNVTLGEGVEVKEVYEEVEQTFATETPAEDTLAPAEEPVDTPEPEENTLEARVVDLENKIGGIVDGVEKIINMVSAFETRIAELEDKLGKLDSEPATDPVEEEPVENKSILSYLK